MKKQILTPELDTLVFNNLLPESERVRILTEYIATKLYFNHLQSLDYIDNITFICDKYEIELTFYFNNYFLLDVNSIPLIYLNSKSFTDFILQPDICTISLSLQKQNIPVSNNIFEITNIIMKHITSFPIVDYYQVFQTQLELYKKLHNTPLSERNEINILKETIATYYVYVVSISKNEIENSDSFKIILEPLSEYLKIQLYYPL